MRTGKRQKKGKLWMPGRDFFHLVLRFQVTNFRIFNRRTLYFIRGQLKSVRYSDYFDKIFQFTKTMLQHLYR